MLTLVACLLSFLPLLVGPAGGFRARGLWGTAPPGAGAGAGAGGGAGSQGDWHWECRDGPEAEVACRCYGPGLLQVPDTLHRSLHSLTVEYAGLEVLARKSLDPYKHSLTDLALRELRRLHTIEPGVFSSLSKLRAVYISRAPHLVALPGGVFHQLPPSFRVLRIVHTGLREVPDMEGLGTGDIIHMMSILRNPSIECMRDLESNRIRHVDSNAVRVRAERLMLDYNSIGYVEAGAFNGSQIAKLSLRGNRRLEQLSAGAFRGLSSLRDLDLSETSIRELPTDGLEELDILRIQDTRTLTSIPSVYSFKHLQEAWLTYAFHCCAFAFPARHDPERHRRHQQSLEQIARLCRESEAGDVSPEVVAELAESEMSWGAPRASRQARSGRSGRSASWGPLQGDADYSGTGEGDYPDEPEGSPGPWADVFVDPRPQPTPPPPHYFDPVWLAADEAGAFGAVLADEGFRSDQAAPPGLGPGGAGGSFSRDFPPTAAEPPQRPSAAPAPTLAPLHDGVFHEVATLPPGKLHAICGNLSVQRPAVRCEPAPDALNPCEDIMGYPWLRALVWVVVAATVAGNLAVLAVLLTNLASLSVPRFLMCHLALADLCMGLYLLLLAAMDLRSRGEYFNYACGWQVEWGCGVAGFLTIFSSQLSIYTLCVITLERWFAITFAIDLNKRLRLGAAAHVMAAGWVYALTMAALPLAGVSSYASTSICLPMDSRDAAGLAYLILLLVVAALAFVVVLVCYLQIYLSLGPDTRRSRRRAPAAPAAPGGGGGGGPFRRSRGSRSNGSGRPTLAARAELSVANKMALLVLTDFMCWAPIAFFSLTALAGHPLINVTNSKILLVFFYPLNACANPFLYAILTAQYRRDLCMLLSRCGLCTKLAQKYKLAGYSSPTTNNSHQAAAARDQACCYDGPETMSSLLATPPAPRTARLLSVDPGPGPPDPGCSPGLRGSRDEAFV